MLGGLRVCALDSGLSDLVLSPGQDYCVLSFLRTVNRYSTSFSTSALVTTGEYLPRVTP